MSVLKRENKLLKLNGLYSYLHYYRFSYSSTDTAQIPQLAIKCLHSREIVCVSYFHVDYFSFLFCGSVSALTESILHPWIRRLGLFFALLLPDKEISHYQTQPCSMATSKVS